MKTRVKSKPLALLQGMGTHSREEQDSQLPEGSCLVVMSKHRLDICMTKQAQHWCCCPSPTSNPGLLREGIRGQREGENLKQTAPSAELTWRPQPELKPRVVNRMSHLGTPSHIHLKVPGKWSCREPRATGY